MPLPRQIENKIYSLLLLHLLFYCCGQHCSPFSCICYDLVEMKVSPDSLLFNCPGWNHCCSPAPVCMTMSECDYFRHLIFAHYCWGREVLFASPILFILFRVERTCSPLPSLNMLLVPCSGAASPPYFVDGVLYTRSFYPKRCVEPLLIILGSVSFPIYL